MLEKLDKRLMLGLQMAILLQLCHLTEKPSDLLDGYSHFAVLVFMSGVFAVLPFLFGDRKP